MRTISLFCIALCLFSCKESKEDEIQQSLSDNYVLDSSWNRQANQYIVSQPTGIGVDKNNHIFIFQRTGRRWTDPFPDSLISLPTIAELDPITGKALNTWGAGYFIMPHGLLVDKDDNIWVTDVALHQIFKFSHDGKLLMTLGEAKKPGNDSSHFNRPTDIAVSHKGDVYISDGYLNSRVVQFSAEGKFIREWGTYGNKEGEFIIPHGITIDQNNSIFVADRQNNRIQVFDTSGKFIKVINNNEKVEQLPSVTTDLQNKLYAIDYDPRKKPDSSVQGSTFISFDSTYKITAHTGSTGAADRSTCWFHDIAVDSEGSIYVGDIIGLKVLKYKRVRN